MMLLAKRGKIMKAYCAIFSINLKTNLHIILVGPSKDMATSQLKYAITTTLVTLQYNKET